MSIVSIAPYSPPILMAGVWLGGLPAFLYVVYDSHRKTDKGSHLLKGNLSSEPTDLLKEPQMARHTAGNFFIGYLMAYRIPIC
jgi:hypothetical protein